jgi:RHS repeat-associated protein
MGLGDFVPDPVEHLIRQGEKAAGKGLDRAGSKAADALDDLGAHGAANWTRQKAHSVGNELGAHVPELELGQTDDPTRLVYGSPGKLRSTASRLRDFHTDFDKVGRGLRSLDSSHWRGKAAEAFREKVAVEPKKWFTASDACEKAAGALEDFADTVHWAQGQAREAIEAWEKANKASDDARHRHNAKVAHYTKALDAYAKAVDTGRDPGAKPAGPGAFHDPGEAGRRAAQEKLADARRQRDDAAATARRAVRAARDAAPARPSYGDRFADGLQGLRLDAVHFDAGIAKGSAGMLGFVRGLNFMDPYNLTHPGQYLTHLNGTLAGLVRMDSDPFAAGRTVLDDFVKDPSEFTGKLVPQFLGTDGLGEVKGAGGLTHDLPFERPPELPAEPAPPPAQPPAPPHEPPAEPPATSGRENLAKDGEAAHSAHDDQRTDGATDPVDLATGRMFLPQTDVTLPGVLPLVFTRRVESGYTAGRWFGPSWSSTADQRLEIDAEGVVFVSEDGLLLAYPHPAPGLPTLPSAGPRWPLERTADGGYTLTDPQSGHVRHFAAPDDDGGGDGGGDGVARLERITDRNGHWITFDHDASGAPTGIVHSAGYHLTLTTENGRITALHLAGAAEDGGDVPLLRYGYTGGHLTDVVNSSGSPLRFAYDERARVTSWTDTNGRRYDYTYDERDRCVAQGGEAGHITLTIDYGAPDPVTGHRATTVTTAQGHTTRYLVNDRCQVLAETDPLGHTLRTEQDRHNRVLSRTDALGRTTRLRYDAAGRLTAVVRPDGRELTAEYDALGLPTTITGPDGSVCRQEYDARGNRTASTDPGGATTRYSYDEHGHLAAVTDPLGHTTRVRCDAAGLPVEVTDPRGATTTYERDAFGRITAVTDPLGATTRLTWTTEGRLARRTGPDGGEESWTYDGEGNRTSHTDATGAVTTWEYTHFDLLAARTGPDGVRHEYTHDASLRLTKVTNPQGLTWTYSYDPAGRLATETDFDGRTLTYTHDPAGRLLARTNALGESTRYEHDVLGNVVARTAGDGRTTTYDYDAAGRLLRAAGPDTTLIHHYDRAGRLKSQTCDGRTLTHTYDALGRPTGRTTPTGATTTYAYDAAGNRTSLATAGHALDFTHDPAGRELTRTLDQSLTLAHTWDEAGRLTTQTVTGPGARIVQHRAYTYRPDGHVTAVADRLRGDRAFDLDPAGRVTAVRAEGWTERYAYDEAGNQTTADWPGAQPGHEATGRRAYTGTRLTRAGAVRYEYDALGRVTARRQKRLSRKPGVWRYTWDAEDHLTTVTTPDGTVWRYLYDPLGRRTAKQRLDADGSVAEQTDFTWDGNLLVEQSTTARDRPNPVVLTWDHQGLHPVAQAERITDATTQEEIDRRFFAIATDLVGTPTELIGEDGTVAWRTRTTLWGTTAWPTRSTAWTPLRFPGQYHDPESGLHYNLHRHYDPQTARYATPDPLGLGPAPNPATYIHNPLTWADPLGLSPCPPEKIRTGTAPAFVTDASGMSQDVRTLGRPDGQFVLSGHGGIRPGDGSFVTVPHGTELVMYSPHSVSINDIVGNAIETGTAKPLSTYGPGEKLPDYWLMPPKDLNVLGAPRNLTVTTPTRISGLLGPNMGRVHWAACRAVPLH